MASIRRTLSPYGDRPYQNGSSIQISLQSTPQKLFNQDRTSFSPVRRFITEILLLKHYPRKGNPMPWRRSLFSCLVFFCIGILLGMAPFSNDIFIELKKHEPGNVEFLELDVRNPGEVGVVERLKTSDGVVDAVESGNEANSEGNDIKQISEFVPRKQLIVVTPTYNRALQAYYLNRLGQVLRLVKPPVLWIVVEMNAASIETSEILRNMGVMYRHVVCKKNSTDVKDRGVHQRNAAIEHIERHKLDGIVYFADDDNIYSLELFESIRDISLHAIEIGKARFMFSNVHEESRVVPFSRFGMWPVGMMTQSKNKAILEGPVCNGSQVIGWHTNEKSKRLRRFHIDMSGFAFNSTILWDPKRWHRPTSDPIKQLDTVKEGFQETTFIEQVVEDESQMEGIPQGCHRIMNWHLHLEAREIVYPRGWILQKNLDAVIASE